MTYEELKELMSRQTETMTAPERMKAYMMGEEVDCIPHSLLAEDPTVGELLGYKTSQMGDIDVLSEIITAKKEWFGEEGISVALDLRTIGLAQGSIPFNPEHGTQRIEQHVLMDYADFDKLKVVDPYTNPILSPMLENARKLKERFPDMTLATGTAGPISTAAAIRPVELLLRDTRKKPDMVRKLLDLCVDSSLKWMEVFCREFGPCPTSIADPVTCSAIFSKKQFDEFSLPYLKRLVDGINNIMKIPPTVHICGPTKAIWDDLGNLNISAFSVDNCEDIEETKKILGDRKMIVGNVPPVDVMCNGTIDEVIEACKDCIRKAADSPMGFQLSTGCQVPLGTPRANMDAFVYAARKYGRGARKGQLPKGILEEE